MGRLPWGHPEDKEGAPTVATRGQRFLGSYTYQLDEKGRVSLPAAFRREAPDQCFVLVQPYPPALTLYPEAAWSEVEDRFRELRERQPKSRDYLLRMMASAVEVVPDAQGRILIPARLQEAAELKGSVLVVGVIDRIELWNPDRFEEVTRAGAAEWEQYGPQVFR